MTDVADGEKSASLLRNSALVGIGTGLSRVTGFARTSALLYALGALAAADAYNLANTTPNIIYELILGGVLTATLVPLFVDAAKSGDDDATNAVVTAAFVGLVTLTIVAIAAAPLILRLYSWSKPADEAATQARLALPLMRLFLPQILFYGLTAVGTSLLNARRSFLAPAFAPVLNNLLVIGVLVWFAQTVGSDPTVDEIAGDTSLVLLLGLGTTAGILAMTVVLWPALKASGQPLRWNFSLRHPAVRAMVRLSGWTLGYAVANQISLSLVLGLANESDGWVTAYAAAFIFFQLPHGLFAVSIMTTFMPELASAASAGDTVEFRRRFAQGARLMSLLVLPASVGYFLLAEPIVSLLKGGSFDTAGVELVAAVLANFAIGLLALSLYIYVLRAFYAMKDTRTPFLVNVGQNACNIVLALLLVGPLGVEGLALAYALSYIIGAVAALAILRHRLGGIEGRSLGTALAKMAVATVMMAAVVVLVGTPISIDTRLGALTHTAVAVVAGALAYAAVAFALGITEVRDLGRRLRKR